MLDKKDKIVLIHPEDGMNSGPGTMADHYQNQQSSKLLPSSLAGDSKLDHEKHILPKYGNNQQPSYIKISNMMQVAKLGNLVEQQQDRSLIVTATEEPSAKSPIAEK